MTRTPNLIITVLALVVLAGVAGWLLFVGGDEDSPTIDPQVTTQVPAHSASNGTHEAPQVGKRVVAASTAPQPVPEPVDADPEALAVLFAQMVAAAEAGHRDTVLDLGEDAAKYGKPAVELAESHWQQVMAGEHARYGALLSSGLWQILKQLPESELMRLAVEPLRSRWTVDRIPEERLNAKEESRSAQFFSQPDHSLMKDVDYWSCYLLREWLRERKGVFPASITTLVTNYSGGQHVAEYPSVWLSDLYRQSESDGTKQAAKPVADIILESDKFSPHLRLQLRALYREPPTDLYDLLDKAKTAKGAELAGLLKDYFEKFGLHGEDLKLMIAGLLESHGQLTASDALTAAIQRASLSKEHVSTAFEGLTEHWVANWGEFPNLADDSTRLIGFLLRHIAGKLSSIDPDAVWSGNRGPVGHNVSSATMEAIEMALSTPPPVRNTPRGRAALSTRYQNILDVAADTRMKVADICTLVTRHLELSDLWLPTNVWGVVWSIRNSYSEGELVQDQTVVSELVEVIVRLNPEDWTERATSVKTGTINEFGLLVTIADLTAELVYLLHKAGVPLDADPVGSRVVNVYAAYALRGLYQDSRNDRSSDRPRFNLPSRSYELEQALKQAKVWPIGIPPQRE